VHRHTHSEAGFSLSGFLMYTYHVIGRADAIRWYSGSTAVYVILNLSFTRRTWYELAPSTPPNSALSVVLSLSKLDLLISVRIRRPDYPDHYPRDLLRYSHR